MRFSQCTVGDLREIAESILEQCVGWDDDDYVETVCNTYHLHGGPCLEVPGGFIDYTDISLEADDEDEYEDEDE